MLWKRIAIFIVLNLKSTLGKKICVVTDALTPYEFSCEYDEDCCGTHCCAKPSNEQNLSYLWFLVLIAAIAFFFFLKYICREEESQSENSNRRPFRFRRRSQQVDNYSNIEDTPPPPLTLPVTVDLQNGAGTSSHPITPPPSYETAVDFDPHNRIPSYEDVMSGKLKLSNPPHL